MPEFWNIVDSNEARVGIRDISGGNTLTLETMDQGFKPSQLLAADLANACFNTHDSSLALTQKFPLAGWC